MITLSSNWRSDLLQRIGKQSKLFECTYGTMVSHCWLCLCTLIPFVLLSISIHVTLAKTISTLKLHYQLLLVGDRAGRNGSSLEVDLIGLFRPIDLKKVTTVLVKVKRSTTNMKGGVQESNGENITYFYQLTREGIVGGHWQEVQVDFIWDQGNCNGESMSNDYINNIYSVVWYLYTVVEKRL